MRNQIPILQQLRVEIDKNPSEPSLKSRLLGVATEIANATSSMLMSDANEKVQRVADTAKKCAEHTKNLVTSFERGSQVQLFFFFLGGACFDFGFAVGVY